MPRSRKARRERLPKYEEVLLVDADWSDLHVALSFLAQRDTSSRLFQRMLTAMNESIARSKGMPTVRFTVE